MESTSTYWKPVFYRLEQQVECWLINAAHIKALPGRKTDVRDAEWIAMLLEHGLVRPLVRAAATDPPTAPADPVPDPADRRPQPGRRPAGADARRRLDQGVRGRLVGAFVLNSTRRISTS